MYCLINWGCFSTVCCEITPYIAIMYACGISINELIENGSWRLNYTSFATSFFQVSELSWDDFWLPRFMASWISLNLRLLIIQSKGYFALFICFVLLCSKMGCDEVVVPEFEWVWIRIRKLYGFMGVWLSFLWSQNQITLGQSCYFLWLWWRW